MNPVEKVVYNRLTPNETVEALAIFLANVPFKATHYWPKRFMVEVIKETTTPFSLPIVSFKVTYLPTEVFVGVVIVDSSGVSIISGPENGLTAKTEFDYIKTALRRMVVAVAYRDFSITKKFKEDRKKELLINGPEGSK